MLNSELLKESIADAKALRATALANAKAALEENFRPRFEAMFADKLKEEEESEEEASMDEVSAPNQVSGKGGEAKGPATKDVSKGQPKKGSAAATPFKTIAVGGSEGAAGSKAPAAKQSIVKETSEEEEEEGKMQEVAEEDESKISSEDLNEIIKELEMEVSDEEEGEVPSAEEVPAPAPAPAPAPEESPEMDIPPTDDIAPETEVPPVAEPDGDEAPAPEVPPVAEPDGDEAPAPEAPAPEAPEVPAPDAEETDEINLDELLAALNEEAEEEEEGKVEEGKLPPWLKKDGKEEEDEKEEMDEISNNGIPKTGQTDKATVKGWPKTASTSSKNHNISGKGNIGSGEAAGKPKMEETAQLKSELNECVKTIEFLRGQLNEVNLLNAKLLYTNKLFKEFAGVLDDQYRMKIVESFDLTKSVREVKLAYALLAESLNFGTQTQKAKTVKTAPRQSVQRITEGLASAPVASTKPSASLITEGVNQMADRFKKLAGIRTPSKK